VDPRVANAVFGFSRFMPILALFLAALLFHRIGTRYAIVFALVGQGLAVLLLGVLTGPLRLVMVFLQPAIGALFFPAGFAALSGLMPRESRNVGISMVLPPAVFLGVGVIPAVVGYMGDTVTFARGFVILGAVMTVIATTAFFVRFREDQ
jgi:MFS transporter, NNP family, nitrate/nitrite transporter